MNSNSKISQEIENLEVKNLKYWASFYNKEAEKQESFLKLFGFEKKDLLQSPQCVKTFNELVSLAHGLKLDNTSQINFMTALKDLIGKKIEKEMTVLQLSSENDKLNEKMLALNLFQETLIKDFKTLNNELPDQKQQLQAAQANIEFMQGKLEKYNVQNEEMEEYMQKIDKSIYHERIVADYQKLQELNKELRELTSKLDVYQDLPTNMSLAELKNQSLRNEIKSIQEQIDQLMKQAV